MINEIQKNEFIVAETILFKRISQINPIIRTFFVNSPKIQSVVNGVEDAILICMNENGIVNGKLLGLMLQEKFPSICEWVNVPASEFRLSDEIKKILNLVIGE